MAQLKDTIILGDARVTDTLYANNLKPKLITPGPSDTNSSPDTTGNINFEYSGAIKAHIGLDGSATATSNNLGLYSVGSITLRPNTSITNGLFSYDKGLRITYQTATPVSAGGMTLGTADLPFSNIYSQGLDIMTGDNNRYITFWYNSTLKAGGGWRIAACGEYSGDNNYFCIQSGTSTVSTTNWTNVLGIGQDTYTIWFVGSLLPQSPSNTQTVGSSVLPWSAMYATTFNGNLNGAMLTEGDNRTVATSPSDYGNKIRFRGLKNLSAVSLTSSGNDYVYVLGLRGWANTSGGHSHEFGFNNSGIYHRIGTSDSAWGAWETIYTSANLSASTLGLGNVENTALSTWAGTSNITTVGTISSGTWNGSTIGRAYGGTGLTSYTKGDLIYASANNTLAKRAIGTSGYVLKVVDGVPNWAAEYSYTHPTDAGNKHIPSGGSSGQYLKYSSSGTAVWAALPTGSSSAAGILQLGTTNSTAAAGDHTHSDYFNKTTGDTLAAGKNINLQSNNNVDTGSGAIRWVDSSGNKKVGIQVSSTNYNLGLFATTKIYIVSGSANALSSGATMRSTDSGVVFLTDALAPVLATASNNWKLGTTTERWQNVYSVAGNFSGALTANTVNGYILAAASAKGVDTSIAVGSNSTNLPTSAAVAAYVADNSTKIEIIRF